VSWRLGPFGWVEAPDDSDGVVVDESFERGRVEGEGANFDRNELGLDVLRRDTGRSSAKLKTGQAARGQQGAKGACVRWRRNESVAGHAPYI